MDKRVLRLFQMRLSVSRYIQAGAVYATAPPWAGRLLGVMAAQPVVLAFVLTRSD